MSYLTKGDGMTILLLYFHRVASRREELKTLGKLLKMAEESNFLSKETN